MLTRVIVLVGGGGGVFFFFAPISLCLGFLAAAQ